MRKDRSFFVVGLVVALCVSSLADAQDEPGPSQWGPLHEGLPGQPAHGYALQHMPGYQPGALDETLPGQPGHGLALQPLTAAQKQNMQTGIVTPTPSTASEPAPSSPAFEPAPVESVPFSSPPEDVPPPEPSLPPQSMEAPPANVTMAYQPPLYRLTQPPPEQVIDAVSPASAPAASSVVTAPQPVAPASSAVSVTTNAPPNVVYQPASTKSFDRDATIVPMNTNPNLNLEPPPKPPQAEAPLDKMLVTWPGLEIGAQDYFDRYMEPNDPTVISSGNMVGLLADLTATYGKYFATAEARHAFGRVDYVGSGTASGDANILWEGRVFVGRDFVIDDHNYDFDFPKFGLSPYIGLGYRYLYNDARGITSTGASGYRRENQLLYIPIGVKPHVPIDEDSRLTGTIEFDPLVTGQQTTYLHDVALDEPDIRNQQGFGTGVKTSLMYETKWWSIGPFFNYWGIAASHVKASISPHDLCLGGSTLCYWVEPENNTIEAGIQMKLRFGFMDDWFRLD